MTGNGLSDVPEVAGTQGVPSAAELARSLGADFRSGYADVNGTRLHYVAGGTGSPLVLLPGWPQTWWQFRKMMPRLQAGQVVVVAAGMTASRGQAQG